MRGVTLYSLAPAFVGKIIRRFEGEERKSRRYTEVGGAEERERDGLRVGCRENNIIY
jgi:hypothetical protein